eukprot:5793736-Amphidinium_carterae.1
MTALTVFLLGIIFDGQTISLWQPRTHTQQSHTPPPPPPPPPPCDKSSRNVSNGNRSYTAPFDIALNNNNIVLQGYLVSSHSQTIEKPVEHVVARITLRFTMEESGKVMTAHVRSSGIAEAPTKQNVHDHGQGPQVTRLRVVALQHLAHISNSDLGAIGGSVDNGAAKEVSSCLLYTSDAADDTPC